MFGAMQDLLLVLAFVVALLTAAHPLADHLKGGPADHVHGAQGQAVQGQQGAQRQDPQADALRAFVLP